MLECIHQLVYHIQVVDLCGCVHAHTHVSEFIIRLRTVQFRNSTRLTSVREKVLCRGRRVIRAPDTVGG